MSNSETDTATRRRAVGEAREDWGTADREITRVRLLHARLAALAEQAGRRVETDRREVLDTFERFGRATGEGTGTAADRRRELRYLGEPLLEREEGETSAIRVARQAVALDAPTATFVDRLAAFVDADGGQAPGWTGNGSVTVALEAVLDDNVRPVEYVGRLDALTTLFGAGVEAATVARDERESTLNEALAAYVEHAGPIPDDLDGQPIALFPVRLETRFVRSEGDEMVANTPNPTQLLVRVYPDQLHVDTHEPELTDGEVRAGEEFWTTVWYAAHPVLPDRVEEVDDTSAGGAGTGEDDFENQYYDERLPSRVRNLVDAVDPGGFSGDPADRYDEVKERAWGLLVERFGRERAAFVVHATAPVDPPDDGDTGGDGGAVASSRFSDVLLTGVVGATDGSFVPLASLEFPEVPRKPESWTRQPRAQLLPDRWVAIARWQDRRDEDGDGDGIERQRTFVGGAIREPMPVGPNPEQLELDGDPDRTAPPGIEWMVDFDRAEAVGMALRIPGTNGDLASLEGFDPNRGFSRLTVLGVRSSAMPDESTEELADLFDAHHYTEGLSVLPQGTPTNVFDTDSGYSSTDVPAESAAVECGPPLVRPADRSDGDLLARALGVGYDEDDGHVFAHVEHADETTQRDARHMNTVLWPAMLGYYVQHLLHPAESDAPFSGPLSGSSPQVVDPLPSPGARLQWLDAYRRHFIRYVRGRGPLPAIRVGEQPYGVLPVAPTVREAERAATDDVDRIPILDTEFTRRLRDALDGVDIDVEVEAGRPLRDYVHPDVPTNRYLDAGFTPDELYRAGVSGSSLSSAGVEPETLATIGVPAGELVDAMDAEAMLGAGFEAPELLEAGYPIGDLAAAGVPVATLVQTGADPRALLEAYPEGAVVSAGITPEALLAAGVTPETLVANGVPLSKLRNAGVSAQSMRASGRTAGELRAAGYAVEELHDAGFDAGPMLNAGFDAATLTGAGFRAADLREAGTSAEELSTQLDAGGLRVAGYSAIELRQAGFEAETVVGAGYTPSELVAAGYDAGSLVDAGVAPASLRNAGVSADQLRATEVPTTQLREAGFSAGELQSTGLSAAELHAAGFSAGELKSAGFDASSLAAAGVDAGTLRRVDFDVAALVGAGIDPTALRKAGVNTTVLADAGVSREELKAAGFSATELEQTFAGRETTEQNVTYGTRVTSPTDYAERKRLRYSFDSGLVGSGLDQDLRDRNFGTDGGTDTASHTHWVAGTRDHLVHDHLGGLIRNATTYWEDAFEGLQWTPKVDGTWQPYTAETLTKLLGRRARSSSARLDGWYGLPNSRAQSGNQSGNEPLSFGDLNRVGPRIAHLMRDGTVETEVSENHLVGLHDATFLEMLANEPLETIRRTGYRIDKEALGVRWDQFDVEEAVDLVNSFELTFRPRRRPDTSSLNDTFAGMDLTAAEFGAATALGIDWLAVGEKVVPRYAGTDRGWENLSATERMSLLSVALKNADTDLSADVLKDITRAIRDSETPDTSPSIEKLVVMFALALDYDDQPALLSSVLRLLTAFGTQHEYLAGRLRLGLLAGDETDTSPERAQYWSFSPTLYDSLFQRAPDALVADANAPAAVGPNDTYADLLYAAASDDPETTAIYPRISEYTDSLAYLSAAFDEESGHLSMAARRSLFLETLDVASHRLDAWWSSLATKRLFELRMVQEGRSPAPSRPEGGGDERGTRVNVETDPSLWSVSPVAGTLASAGLDDATGAGTETTAVSLTTPTFLHRAAATVAVSEAAYDAGLFRHVPREWELPSELEADPTLDELIMGVGAVDSDPGIYVGAYGFVENLRPDTETVPNANASMDTDTNANASEYIHAPSQQHARTAAILRSADLAHDLPGGDASSVHDAISVDLSADRVREAKRLVDGVRHGQSLEELLGYRFERGLHERSSTSVNLVQYKDTLRKLFPVQKEGVVEGAGSDGEPVPTKLATTTVVDARALVEAWPLTADDVSSERASLIEGLLDGPDPELGRGSEAYDRLDGLVADLEDTIDAVSDLLLAESVHQIAQGNFDAAGVSLDTLAKGEGPPELTVTRTPRSSVGVTHRTVVVLDDPATAAVPDGWRQERTVAVPSAAGDEAGDDGPSTGRIERLALDARSRAEPSVNAWLGELFPAPDQIRCVATYRWEQDDETRTHQTVVTFADLDLSPLDALHATATDPSARPGASELETRIGYLLSRREAAALPDGSETAPELRLSFTETAAEGEEPPQGVVSVGEFLELARSVRDVLVDARPADAADLTHPTETAGPGYDDSAVRRPGTEDDGNEETRRRSLVARADETQSELEAVSRRLEDRLSVLAPDDESTSDDAESVDDNGSEDAAGETPAGDPGSASGENGASEQRRAPGLPAQVDRFLEASRGFTEGISLSALGAATEGATASALLDDLAALAAALPAGEMASEEVAVTVEAAPEQTVAGVAPPAWDESLGGPVVSEPLDEDGEDTQPAEDPRDDTPGGLRGLPDGRRRREREKEREEGEDPSEPTASPRDRQDAREGGEEPGVPEPESPEPSEPEPRSIEVSLWSRSPTAWFTRSARTEAAPDGSFDVTFDFGDVEPGTEFTVVATDVEGGRVSYAATGRVVAADEERDGPSPESIVEGSETLRNLLDLAAVRDRFAVRVGDRSAEVTTAGSEAAGGTDAVASPATDLSEAWSALDWDALRRERELAAGLANESGTTLTDADLASIDVLLSLETDDPAAIDAAFEAAMRPVARTGLAETVDLVTVVDRDTGSAENDSETEGSERTVVYIAKGASTTLRNRLERGTADPARLRTNAAPDLLDYHPQFASMLRRLDPSSDGEHAARDVRALLTHPAMLVEVLDEYVDAPEAVLRDLTALAYHGDRGDQTFATRLRAVGTAIEGSGTLFEAERRDRLGTTLVALADELGRVGGTPPGLALPEPAAQRSTFETEYGESLTELGRLLGEASESHTDLQTTAPSVSEAVRGAVLESLRGVLVHASSFGVYGSTPESATGRTPADEQVLRGQAQAVATRIAARMEQASPLRPTESDLQIRPLDELVADQRTRLEALLDDAFVVFPPFRPTNETELRATFDDDDLLDGAGPLAAETWLQRSARAREHVAGFSEALSYAETLRGQLRPSLSVGQLPHATDAETVWAGVDANPQPGVLSLVAQFDAGGTAEALVGPTPVTGLLIDEWVEEVPSDEETTGIALRYDAPGARPPQSVLLAVPPTDRPWSVGSLEETITETAEFVRYRGLDLADLRTQDAVTTLLPALMFPKNSADRPHAPSVDFEMLHRYNMNRLLNEIDRKHAVAFRDIDLEDAAGFRDIDVGSGGDGA